jgi:hypothetical protein
VNVAGEAIADEDDQQPFSVSLSPGARRALSKTLPAAAAFAAWKFEAQRRIFVVDVDHRRDSYHS